MSVSKVVSFAPKEIRSLRPITNRESWLVTLQGVGHPTHHLSKGGGYIHQTLFELFQKDAKALNVKFLFHSIHHLENHVLVPEMKKQLKELNLSTEGNYGILRKRLGEQKPELFDWDFRNEKMHADSVIKMMQANRKGKNEKSANIE